MPSLLEVHDLAVHFHTIEGTVFAVNGISYTLDEGETLGIVGESGCGKSVSVLSLMRLIPEPPGKITSGRALFQGEDLLQIDMARMRSLRGAEIAMIFQDPMTSLNPVLSIGLQITEALQIHRGMSQDEALSRAVEFLDMVGIPKPAERLGEYPHQFSGGMRQRAMIAMALVCEPKILIADEPTTALDVTIQAQIVDLVKDLRDRLGMSVIWITHDLGVIAELADRVIVMYAGFIVEETDVFTLFKNPVHPYTTALLQSLPRIDHTSSDRLATIQGVPPNCINLPPGCPFAPRCFVAKEPCFEATPTLVEIEPGHKVACWMEAER
jgi:oligopeptide transport system ATP-binding protein